MRPQTLSLSLLASLALALCLLPAVASSVETTPTIEAVYPQWSPEQEAIKPTKTIDFVNKNGILHGVRWTGGPVEPKCTGVPIDTSSSSWSGSCEFEQEGTYTFECTVHPFMKGTVYVNASGTIPPPPPVATTEPATSVTETGTTLNGAVNPKGQETTYEFEYGPTIAYGSTTTAAKLVAGSTSVAVSAAITGLAPGSPYHFRLVAKNAAGTTDGADQTFTTSSPPPPPGSPTASTEAATSVSEGSATLKGTVNPDGQTTSYVFEYGTTASYGQQTAELALAASDHASHSVSATVAGLVPGTIYHFRLRATNVSGEAEGLDREFTTTSPPATPSPPPPTPSASLPPTTTTPTSATPPLIEAPAFVSPLVAGSLKILAAHHRGSVHVSLAVAKGGAPARLEVDLLAKLGHGHRQAVVGRIVRSSLAAGKASFSVAPNIRVRSTLRRQRKLTATVKVTLTPPIGGAAVTVTRNVVLRA